MFCEIYLRIAKRLTFLRIGHGYSSDSTLVTQNQFTSWGLVIEKCYKKSIFQGLKLPVSIRGNVEFISPFVSSTFELIAFLSSNFKVTVAVAFLQRKDNLICFDGDAISYSVNANLFDKTGDLWVSAQAAGGKPFVLLVVFLDQHFPLTEVERKATNFQRQSYSVKSQKQSHLCLF